MAQCSKYYTSEEYIDILYRRSDVFDPPEAGDSDYCISTIDDRWGIVHLNMDGREAEEVTYEQYGYTSFPLVYGVQSLQTTSYGAMNETGILRVREQPFLALRGSGTLVGIVDTGIRYDHEAFVREDGSSKIEAIWDQTQPEPQEAADSINRSREAESLVPFGRVYVQETINEALNSNPDIVPVTDVADGHGTFLAGIAAGRENINQGFTGAAPDAGLVIVKLKEAKRYLREFYLVNDEALCYSEIDIILGIRFLSEYAALAGKPISIIIGLGTNLSAHAGSTVLSDYIDNVGRDNGRCVVICAGNYAASRLHYTGRIKTKNMRGFVQDSQSRIPFGNDMMLEYIPIEIRVGEGNRGFFCGLWSKPPEVFSLEFVSPTGRVEQRVPPKVRESTTLRFLLEGTEINILYGLNQAVTGLNFVAMRFINPSPGIWTIRAYGDSILAGGFDVWLSNREFLWSDTYFLQSDPYNTITDPGNSQVPITVGAYDYRDGSIYIGSGRGPLGTETDKPDIVAPGVNVLGPGANRRDSYVERTGTSIAAAIAGGGAALILEYGIVRGFYPFMRSFTVRNYMVSGAVRSEGTDYPNPIFGYGYMNIYQAIENIRR